MVRADETVWGLLPSVGLKGGGVRGSGSWNPEGAALGLLEECRGCPALAKAPGD